MGVLQGANLALRFVLELCAMAAFAYWGWQSGGNLLLQLVLALGAVALFAIIWGIFLAPRSARRLHDPAALLLELLLFGLAAAALYLSGQPLPALVLLIVYIINRALVSVWGQYESQVRERR